MDYKKTMLEALREKNAPRPRLMANPIFAKRRGQRMTSRMKQRMKKGK